MGRKGVDREKVLGYTVDFIIDEYLSGRYSLQQAYLSLWSLSRRMDLVYTREVSRILEGLSDGFLTKEEAVSKLVKILNR